MTIEVTNASIKSSNLTLVVSEQNPLEVGNLIKRGQQCIKDALFGELWL